MKKITIGKLCAIVIPAVAVVVLVVTGLLLTRGGAGEAARDGIASETISRHSVSYTAQTSAETVAGYPAHLFAFVDPYRRARF